MRVPFDIVVAADRCLGIGKAGVIPWRLPADVAFFRRLTMGEARPDTINAVIMGRVTWESLPPRFRPLPGRLNVVLSRHAPKVPSNVAGDVTIDAPAGVLIEHSVESALARLGQDTSTRIDHVFVIGGTQTYEAALATGACRDIYITRVDGDFGCDRFFPHFEDRFTRDQVLEEGSDQGIAYRIERWRATAPGRRA